MPAYALKIEGESIPRAETEKIKTGQYDWGGAWFDDESYVKFRTTMTPFGSPLDESGVNWRVSVGGFLMVAIHVWDYRDDKLSNDIFHSKALVRVYYRLACPEKKATSPLSYSRNLKLSVRIHTAGGWNSTWGQSKYQTRSTS